MSRRMKAKPIVNMTRKLVLLVSLLVCILAYLISPYFVISVGKKLLQFIPGFEQNTNDGDVRVLTKQELSKYKGENEGKIYLAIVGHVYDVSTGSKHYGPGGGYEFFAGVDGSKAYVTGQFDTEGLVDDISQLSPAEILSLENWKSFYAKDYTYVGKVEGAFYDIKGRELPMMDIYKKKLKQALLEKDLLEYDRKLFPPCNSEWSQASGGRVWCTTRSGGIEREWVGVPRMYYTAGSQKPRCACVRTTGPPSHDLQSTDHKNRGDLDNPNLNLYPYCDEVSESCTVPQHQ